MIYNTGDNIIMTNTELKTETTLILTYSPATNLSILLNLITEAIIIVQQKNSNTTMSKSDLNSEQSHFTVKPVRMHKQAAFKISCEGYYTQFSARLLTDLNSDDIIENIALIISRLMMKKLAKVKKIAAEKDELKLKSDRENKEKLLKLEDRTSDLIAEVLEDGYVLEQINDWNKNGTLQNKIDSLKQHIKED